MFFSRRPSLIAVIWLVIGLIVAANRGYLTNLGDVSSVLSALLAIVAWPLVLLNVKVAI
jgi:hypothetical protein